MKAYELLYFINPALSEEEIAAVNEKVSATIAGINGKIESIDEWGKRKLAYEIQDISEGIYYLVNFQAEPDTITELNRVLRITEGIVRFMVTRRVEEQQD